MAVKRKLGGASVPRAPGVKSLTVRDFLALVDEGVRGGLGVEYAQFESRQRFGYAQYWPGPGPREHWMHYEIWVQRKTQRLEIGLHFEGDRERSYAAAALLAECAADIAAAVGPEYELEEWTPSWTRLHRSLSAPSLTPELAAEAAERACALIAGMEPLARTLGLRDQGP